MPFHKGNWQSAGAHCRSTEDIAAETAAEDDNTVAADAGIAVAADVEAAEIVAVAAVLVGAVVVDTAVAVALVTAAAGAAAAVVAAAVVVAAAAAVGAAAPALAAPAPAAFPPDVPVGDAADAQLLFSPNHAELVFDHAHAAADVI